MLSFVLLGLLAVTTAAPTADDAAPFDAVAHAAKVLVNVKVGYFGDPVECMKYYTAVFNDASGVYVVHRMTCPLGTYWDATSQACAHGTCANKEVPCKGDYYADTANCAAYYQCAHGVAWRMCCPAGTGWNSTANQCGHITCSDTPDCPVQKEQITTTAAPTTFCTDGTWKYEKKDGDDNAYIQTKLDDEKIKYNGQCNAGSGPFSLAECGCLQEKVFEHSKCFDFTFANSFGNSMVYVEGFKATLKNSAACFAGDGYLGIPYYNNNPFGGKGVQLTFKYTGDGKNALLLTNGGCNLHKASIQVEIVDGFIKVYLRTSIDEYILQLKAKSDLVVFKYDGQKLSLAVGDNESTTTATGEIITVACDVKMGVNLNGCLQNVKICEA